MNEFGSKFVDKGEHSRDSRSGARQPGMPAALGSSAPPNAKSLLPALARQRSARADYAVAIVVVAALAVAAFVLGRLRASSVPASSRARQHVSDRAASPSPVTRAAPATVEAAVPRAPTLAAPRRELPMIPFVPIEVEPAHGEIWLDREVAGVGSVQLGAIDDGALHELRFVAPEHETKTLFFRNTPPAGRVVLKRIVRQEAAAPEVAPRTARGDAPAGQRPEQHRVESAASRTVTQAEPTSRVARGPTVAARTAARARPSPDDASSDANSASKKAPRIQLIEVHMPRVEVLD